MPDSENNQLQAFTIKRATIKRQLTRYTSFINQPDQNILEIKS